MSILAFLAAGSCLTLVAVSWLPLWRVELPTGHFADMSSGTFWQFLDNVPGALENLSTPREPQTILTILPSVFFWDNVGTTVSVLILGAFIGLAFWFFRPCGWRVWRKRLPQ
jgi:hypothetical protein